MGDFYPVIMDAREKMDDPEHLKDFESLYDAGTKIIPNLSVDTVMFEKACIQQHIYDRIFYPHYRSWTVQPS